MDFEHSKNTTYMDTMDSPFSYMDNGLEYLQPYPPSPSFGVSMGRTYLLFNAAATLF